MDKDLAKESAKELTLDPVDRRWPVEPPKAAHDDYQTTRLQNVKKRIVNREIDSGLSVQKRHSLRRSNSRRKV